MENWPESAAESDPLAELDKVKENEAAEIEGLVDLIRNYFELWKKK